MTTTVQTRRCIGSSRFGIEAHEAPSTDFPVQPSQKDGLGRLCKPHWREYVNGLRKSALARKAAEGTTPTESQVSRQQRRAMAQAAGKVPAADGSVPAKPRRPRRAGGTAEASDVPQSVRRFIASRDGHLPPPPMDAGAQEAALLPAASLEEAWDNAQAARKRLAAKGPKPTVEASFE